MPEVRVLRDEIHAGAGAEVTDLKYGLPAHLIGTPDENGCEIWLGYISHGGYGAYGKHVKPAHRLVFTFVYGEIPAGIQLDHICHVKACVAPEHLQMVTPKQNMENRKGPQRNSTSGIRGVHWNTREKKWRVQVKHNGKIYWGGRFTDLTEAEKAAIALRNRLFTNNLGDRERLAAMAHLLG